MNEFTARIKRFVFEFFGEKNLKTAQNRENLDKELLNDSLMKNTFSRNYLLNKKIQRNFATEKKLL